MAQAHRQHDHGRWWPVRTAPAAVLGLAVAGLALCGCQSGPLAVWNAARDQSLSKAPTKSELGDDRGLMARWLTPRPTPHYDPAKTTPLVLGPNGWEPPKVAANPEADAEYKAAETLFQQGQLPRAEKAFASIAKKRKGTPWGEKAQFYLAEAYYQEGKLVYAHDALDQLFADYPGSLFMDKLVAREFAIGLAWQALSDSKAKPAQELPWNARFDGHRPLLDTNGYAVKVFEHVRQHDATGPLADDATMKLADLHMNNGDYESAAIYYDQLISEYPKSPYLQRAQLAAITARMKGYIGPEYDGSGLEKARELIKQTMYTFPDRPAANEELYHTLDLINDQDAERTFTTGEFYKRTGKVASAEFYFGKIPQRWPQSPWAAKAKTELAMLAKAPRTQTLPSKIMSQLGADPFNRGNNGGMMGGMGGGGMGGAGMGAGGMGGPGGMM